jgi:BolA protein
VTVQESIERKLRENFKPTQLRVVNESSMHSVPPGAESHFRVLIVSSAFERQSLVHRHRMVHAAIGDDIRKAIHALSIAAQTPTEWECDPNERVSPACMGGTHQPRTT